MCGIVGAVLADREALLDERRLWSAVSTLRHRGPDGEGVWVAPGVGLGHTRLAIIDRARGQQPMFTADGRYGVLFNGEIYNHHEIRRELEQRGDRFKTTCDAEVLPYLFARLGPAMVHRLRGMFAFAIFDRATRSLFLARDQFGKKPLYLTGEGGNLFFASSTDALAAVIGRGLDLSAQSLYEYLVLQYVPSPLSPFAGVSKLAPGHMATWRNGRLRVDRYWSPPPRSRVPGRHPPDGAELSRLRDVIGDAVRVRLESEVPLGIFLSGGIDSSIVAIEAAAAGAPLRTFSVGFRSAALDESRYARLVAETSGADHTELVADENVTDLFTSFVQAYDEPFADSSALAMLAVARAAAGRVTVVLTGDGGDEMFGGYDRYRWFMGGAKQDGTWLRRVRRRRDGLWRAAAPGIGAGRSLHAPWPGYRDRLFHFPPAEAWSLLLPDIQRHVRPDGPARRLDALRRAGGQTASGLLWIDMQTYLPDDVLTKADRATMANGLEARSPLLDQRVAQISSQYADEWLFDHPQGKGILRRAYRGFLPSAVLDRQKQGFGVPLADWLRRDLRDRVEEMRSVQSPLWQWLRRDVAVPVVTGFLGGDDGQTLRAWNLLALSAWLESRMEVCRPPVPSGERAG